MELHIHHYYHPTPEAVEWLKQFSGKLEKMMHTLDELLADVRDERTKIDSLVTFVQGLQQQVKDALNSATSAADAQAKIDTVFDEVEKNKAEVVAAMTANTPPEAPPAPLTSGTANPA